MLPLKAKKARLHLLNIFKEGPGAAELDRLKKHSQFVENLWHRN